jgi:uncharacterized membrane protein
MDPSVQEWLNLAVRWAHVIAAIMWIGDSFLFMWLDSQLRTPTQPREGDVVGELWMAHSGGFYEVIKRKSLTALPAELHWFKWESYTTWITGFLLLIIVYWAGGRAMLLDANSPMAQSTAVAISFGILAASVAIYHALCRSPLIRSVGAFSLFGLVAVVAGSYAMGLVFTPRAVFLQIGAMLGSIMASNVFFIIIPAQREMLAATAEGRTVDTSYGARAKARSAHNHYLTFPVLFTMLSNHFPSLYGNPTPWAVLGLISVVAVGVKVVMRTRTSTPVWIWGGTLAALVATIVLTLPPSPADADPALLSRPHVAFSEVRTIITARCVTCHAQQPTFAGFAAPPQGVVMESAAEVAAQAQRMMVRVVQTKTMPLGNLTAMTDDERLTIGAWIVHGADVNAATMAPTTP